jgi:hypothetical protein
MWNVQVPFFQTAVGNGKPIVSSFFSSLGTPKWRLLLFDKRQTIRICAWHYKPKGRNAKIVEPAIAKISMINGKGHKVLQLEELFDGSSVTSLSTSTASPR